MFININSIRIKRKGDNNYLNLGNYTNDATNPQALILEAKYGYNKLWGSDSGRNLAGSMTGTLVGIFPKITIQFKKLSRDELELLQPILDAPTQIVEYYDPKNGTITMETYTGDWEVTNKSIINNNHKNEGFSISFIARKKRT